MGADGISASDLVVGFDALYGLQIREAAAEFATAVVPVTEHLLQPTGLVHGGVYSAIAESLASIATALAVMPEGRIAVGLSNQTNFLRPITGGEIHATARRRHAGSTTWVWEVEMTDDDGRLCALTRMTISVRVPRE